MRTLVLGIGVASMATLCASAEAFQADNPYGGGTRLTGPAPAQIPESYASKEDRARIVTQRFAACMIKLRRAAIVRAIEPEPWQPEARRKLATTTDSRCLERGELVMAPALLRGAYYQQLYQLDFASRRPILPPTAIDFTAASTGALTDEAKTEIALRQFGDCVARSDPGDSVALILSTPGTAEETNALGALMPHFGGCLVRGSKWTLNRSSVTAILSEVVYREATSAGERPTK
jgi:hypothetical protein